jgi:hypothetical protein
VIDNGERVHQIEHSQGRVIRAFEVMDARQSAAVEARLVQIAADGLFDPMARFVKTPHDT